MHVRQLQLVEKGAAEDAGPVLRVAIATQDMKSLNAHFGSARRFAIYEVTPGTSRFVRAVSFDDTSDESGSHRTDGDDRIGPKVASIACCTLLFVLAIGGPAAAKVVGARIHPVKLPAPEPIEDIIRKVQAMMTGNPPPWLRKAMALGQPRSMDHLDDED
ncbi:nitrogen fixation protein NifX [Roseomonas sp. NAR14]|uniref:Nitrogen fixation protein NifX n=1 Tax=Roseomonas acroporae TaxID=2937791 RepID=A0A9X1Y871_9PROT|nr:nitrogen fixation protein NifX [Roseomonas acroporae]MCK8784988.1 nitrogen fixation protein NifX [Roseomonas acroporae]